MPQAQSLRVEGYREFLTACDHAGRETKKYVRDTLRASGDAVKADATTRFARYDAKTAAGYRTRVRRTGVQVEQSLKKSAVEQRRRPKFGTLQMAKALLPALKEKEPETIAAFEHATDEIVAHFERTAL